MQWAKGKWRELKSSVNEFKSEWKLIIIKLNAIYLIENKDRVISENYLEGARGLQIKASLNEKLLNLKNYFVFILIYKKICRMKIWWLIIYY